MEDINKKCEKSWKDKYPKFGTNPYYSDGFSDGYILGLQEGKNCNIPDVVNCKHVDYTPCYGREGELMFRRCDICGEEFD